MLFYRHFPWPHCVASTPCTNVLIISPGGRCFLCNSWRQHSEGNLHINHCAITVTIITVISIATSNDFIVLPLWLRRIIDHITLWQLVVFNAFMRLVVAAQWAKLIWTHIAYYFIIVNIITIWYNLWAPLYHTCIYCELCFCFLP